MTEYIINNYKNLAEIPIFIRNNQFEVVPYSKQYIKISLKTNTLFNKNQLLSISDEISRKIEALKTERYINDNAKNDELFKDIILLFLPNINLYLNSYTCFSPNLFLGGEQETGKIFSLPNNYESSLFLPYFNEFDIIISKSRYYNYEGS